MRASTVFLSVYNVLLTIQSQPPRPLATKLTRCSVNDFVIYNLRLRLCSQSLLTNTIIPVFFCDPVYTHGVTKTQLFLSPFCFSPSPLDVT